MHESLNPATKTQPAKTPPTESIKKKKNGKFRYGKFDDGIKGGYLR